MSLTRGMLTLLVLVGSARMAGADEPGPPVRYFEHNGITYRETREVYRRPILQYEYETQTRTVMQPKREVEQQTVERRVAVPATQNVEQVRWHNQWNPFQRAYPVRVTVPVTTYTYKTEQVTVPVERVTMVPVQQEVRVPVLKERLIAEEFVRRERVDLRTQTAAVPASPNRPASSPAPLIPGNPSTAPRPQFPTGPDAINGRAPARPAAQTQPDASRLGMVPVARPLYPTGRPANAPPYYGFARPQSGTMVAGSAVPGSTGIRFARDADGWRESTQTTLANTPKPTQTQPTRR